jgi:hypothetical protein
LVPAAVEAALALAAGAAAVPAWGLRRTTELDDDVALQCYEAFAFEVQPIRSIGERRSCRSRLVGRHFDGARSVDDDANALNGRAAEIAHDDDLRGRRLRRARTWTCGRRLRRLRGGKAREGGGNECGTITCDHRNFS